MCEKSRRVRAKKRYLQPGLSGILHTKKMTTTHTTTCPETPQSPQALAKENAQLKAEIQWLKEQLGLAKHRLFAPSTEKTPVGQEAMLFNEAEACAAAEVPEVVSETITYTRRKFAGQRELNLAGLPIEEILYDLPK